MALILSCRDYTPQFGQDCFLAENATVIGDVVLGDQCSVWFQAVVRGDVIQDGAILHGTFQKCGTTIGNNVSIGHRALVHGCTLHDNVLVGMGAIIMDQAVVEENCLIAAGALILEKTVCHTGGVYAGVPARRVKELSPELFEGEIQRIARNYTLYAKWY
jgi:carbonic anhydrase/acetyltransferase-like protein (isoleucine patch superfamily)